MMEKNQGIFMGIFMGIFSREIMNNGGILRIFQHFLNHVVAVKDDEKNTNQNLVNM